MMNARRILILPLVVVLSWFQGCAVNPVTGKNEINFVSESQELAIGKKNYGPYRQAQGGDYVVDAELNEYVKSVGARLAEVSDRKLPYEFSVINDSSPNAWALPGGKIAINRGLLLELGSEAELAAVLGHEIVHAAARHTAQSMERSVFLQGALMAAGVALGGTGYRDVGMLGANVGAQLTQQTFSRDAETEADLYGMRYMQRAGYDPAAAIDLQQTFVRLAEGKQANWLAGLFASHPPSQGRVDANRAEYARMGSPKGEVGKARYQRMIARLKRTEPAYDAYAEAQQAFSKDQPEKALRLLKKAISIEPKEAAFHGLRGEIRAEQGKHRAALKNLDTAVALNPGHYRPWLVRGFARRQSGKTKGAMQDLQRSIGLLPTAEGYFGMGLLAQKAGQRDKAVSYLRKAASSDSGVGKRASKRLARLDLEDNPSRYLKSALGLTKKGYLVVQLKNTTELAVDRVRVAIGQQTRGGIRAEHTLRLRRAVRPGQTVQLETDIGPMKAAEARRYGVAVSSARLVE